MQRKARSVGTSVPRVEDLFFVTGRGPYTDDFRFDSELHYAVVRSSQAHAIILSINAEEASVTKGVAAVRTCADCVADGMACIQHQPNPVQANDITEPFLVAPPTKKIVDLMHWPLARDRVRYVGEAVVIAATAEIARDAAELLGCNDSGQISGPR